MRLLIQDAVVTIDGVSGRIDHDRAGRRGHVELAGTRFEYVAAGLEHSAGTRLEVRSNGYDTTAVTHARGECGAYVEIGHRLCAIRVRDNTVFDDEAVVGHVSIRGDVVDVQLAWAGPERIALAFLIALNGMYEWRRGPFRP